MMGVPQALIKEIRDMIDDYLETNPLPGKYSGQDLRDEDIAIAIEQARSRINAIHPRTSYGFSMPSPTLQALFKELAMYYALLQIVKHLTREIMVTGGNVQVDDDRSRMTAIQQYAMAGINDVLRWVQMEKQAIDSQNFLIVD